MKVSPLSDWLGHLDGISDGRLHGWLWSSLADGKPLRVQFQDDHDPVGEVRADTFREDLLDAGIGDGCHSFSWQLPDELYDGAIHRLRAVCALTGRELVGSSISVTLPEKARLTEAGPSLEVWLMELEKLSFQTVAKRVQRRDAITYLYLILLGRHPDEVGRTAYSERLENTSFSFNDLLGELIKSEEFGNKLSRRLMSPEDVIRVFQERWSIYGSPSQTERYDFEIGEGE